MPSKTSIPVARDTAATPDSLPRASTLSPWFGIGGLRSEMERLFDAFEPRVWFEPDARARGDDPLCPAIDLSENEDHYTVTSELPGLEADDIEVKLTNNSLSITGEKSEQKEKMEGETYHLRERRWGRFERRIHMPEDVDSDKISAQFAKGILTVTLPKSAEARAAERRVEVNSA